jgi:hypothetical protein
MRVHEGYLYTYLTWMIAGAEEFDKSYKGKRSEYYYRLLGLLLNLAYPGHKEGPFIYPIGKLKSLFATSKALTIPIRGLVPCLFDSPKWESKTFWNHTYLKDFYDQAIILTGGSPACEGAGQSNQGKADKYPFNELTYSLDSVILTLAILLNCLREHFEKTHKIASVGTITGASEAWMEDILSRPEVRGLQSWLNSFEPPPGKKEKESMIVDMIKGSNVDDLDRKILKCLAEEIVTAPAIGKKLNKHPSTVRDRITKLYAADPNLQKIAPKPERGRPAKKNKNTHKRPIILTH